MSSVTSASGVDHSLCHSLAFSCFSVLLLTTVCIILEVKGARSGCTLDLDSDRKLLSIYSEFLF